jgi:hypothetical protein
MNVVVYIYFLFCFKILFEKKAHDMLFLKLNLKRKHM